LSIEAIGAGGVLPARLFVVKLGPFGDKNSFVGKLSNNFFIGINPVHCN
jgi:hypothetical protein